jgi:predicted restriction endonuclease
MLKGENYARKNNHFATEYFLSKIHQDFGIEALANAVAAVDQHVEYYRQLGTGSDQPGVRRIAERFRKIINDSAARDSEGLTRDQRKLFQKELSTGDFDAADETDARRRTVAAIVQRQGQAEFRQKLLRAYDNRCAITGCSVPLILDAAHIKPYRGPTTNHVQNGLLLRTDLHTLFDVGLLAIDTSTMSIVIALRLYSTDYEAYEGQRVRLPVRKSDWPNKRALDMHWSQSDCRLD